MYVTANGVRLFFDVEGVKLVPDGPAMRARPTLVLVHGAPGFADHTSFKPTFFALRDTAQVVFFDLRGCGRSDAGPPDRWTVEQWADDLRELCDALDIERPVVLAHSNACFVALTHAIRHPERVAKLILSSPQARLDVERTVAAHERFGGREAAAAARGWFSGPGDTASLAEYLRVCLPLLSGLPNWHRQCVHGVASPGLFLAFHAPPDGIWHRADLRAALHEVRCPTLVLAGERDPVAPIEDALDLVAGLPAGLARLERFSDCGHGPWYDDPDAVLTAIRDFLRT